MIEDKELGNVDKFTDELIRQADIFRAASEYCDSQIESLAGQRDLLVKLGAQFPMAMASTDFIIEQVAASTKVDVEVPVLIPKGSRRLGRQRVGHRSRARSSTRLPTEHSGDRIKRYSISPQVKPIMNAIFSSDCEEIPQSLDGLFLRMYGNEWQLRTITVPLRPGAHNLTTLAEDLNSGNSYIRKLLRGADEVICVNMRSNENPDFAVGGRVATAELRQLYDKIRVIGWSAYDDFMIRTGIREPQNS